MPVFALTVCAWSCRGRGLLQGDPIHHLQGPTVLEDHQCPGQLGPAGLGRAPPDKLWEQLCLDQLWYQLWYQLRDKLCLTTEVTDTCKPV